MSKTYTLKQIQVRIDSLYNALDHNQLRLDKSINSVESLADSYRKVDALDRKILKLKQLFKRSAVDVISARKNQIAGEIVLGTPDPKELIKKTNELRKLQNDLSASQRDLALIALKESDPVDESNPFPDSTL